MQRYYLAAYDISCPKRIRLVSNILESYGIRWQYSLFFCKLKGINKKTLLHKVSSVLNLVEDQFILIDLGIAKPMDLETLGKSLPTLAEDLLVT